jgi:putative transposase
VNENQVICAETLDVKKMMKNKSLARSIGDAGWGTLLQFLKYKSRWYGRQFVEIDPFFPSTKQCCHCKEIHPALTLKDREWTCPHCHVKHDRDVSAAVNIREEGLRMLSTMGHMGIKAYGADVRPIWKTRGQSAVK